MTKVAIKNENITSFGGIYHIMDVFSKLGFEKLTESVLGKRGSSGKAFSHGSILGSLFFSYLCGGDCLEDINALIGQFKQRPDTLLPGADTMGRGLKELAEENIIYKSETSDKSYSFNTAQKLTSTEKDIITFYNERGASEKNFDIQNNDFGWSHLPFSFMAENMVFMMVTAMLKNFYLYLVRHISDKVKPLKKTSRLKAFILHFVSVPAKWVRTGRQNVLNLYTNKTYYSEVFIE
nr:hypothetical protein [uncultured Porphyromonas sp.]